MFAVANLVKPAISFSPFQRNMPRKRWWWARDGGMNLARRCSLPFRSGAHSASVVHPTLDFVPPCSPEPRAPPCRSAPGGVWTPYPWNWTTASGRAVRRHLPFPGCQLPGQNAFRLPAVATRHARAGRRFRVRVVPVQPLLARHAIVEDRTLFAQAGNQIMLGRLPSTTTSRSTKGRSSGC